MAEAVPGVASKSRPAPSFTEGVGDEEIGRKEEIMIGSSSKSRTSARAGSRSKRAAHRVRTKDPRGGLTAAGREEFRRTDGAHLKPGVKKPTTDMSAEDMRRKGSWAVRFYGRSGSLPPLSDKNGKPTRFALTAAAWGEPVPKTVQAARKIAAKGRRLLEKSKKLKTQRG